MRMLVCALVVAGLMGYAPQSKAEDAYPNRAIEIIVPFGAGSATDVQVRIVAERLSGRLGQPVIVVNKGGADGAIAAEFISRAKPDGYTLITLTNGLFGIAPLYGPQSWNPLTFTAISGMAKNTQLLVVNPSFPARSIDEFVRYAKKHPDVLNVGYGNTSGRMSAELIKLLAEIRIVPVGYKTGGERETMTDVLGGHIPAAFLLTTACLGQVKSGALRALAIVDTEPFASLPNVPTIDSDMAAFSDIVGILPRGGIAGPPGLPPEIAGKLSGEIQGILSDPEVRAKFQVLGAVPDPMTPAEHRAYMLGQSARWTTLVKRIGIGFDPAH